MRTAVRVAVAAFAAVTLVACQDRPSAETKGTRVQPAAEPTPPPAEPESGGTINWDDRVSVPSAGTTAAATPGGPATNSPPNAIKLPPGTVIPSPEGADSDSVGENAPQSGAPTGAPEAPVGPAVTWRSGIQGDTVWVEITDTASFYRVDRVDLVAPDGRAFAARDITRTQARYDYTADTSNIGVGAWGGSHHRGVGIGIGFPLGGRGSEREDNATRSVARFALADPAAYGRTAASWSVRARLVDRNGQASVARFPAPKPARY